MQLWEWVIYSDRKHGWISRTHLKKNTSYRSVYMFSEGLCPPEPARFCLHKGLRQERPSAMSAVKTVSVPVHSEVKTLVTGVLPVTFHDAGLAVDCVFATFPEMRGWVPGTLCSSLFIVGPHLQVSMYITYSPSFSLQQEVGCLQLSSFSFLIKTISSILRVYSGSIEYIQNAVRPLSVAISTTIFLQNWNSEPINSNSHFSPASSNFHLTFSLGGFHLSVILPFNKEETFPRNHDEGFSSGAVGWHRLNTYVLTKSSVWSVQKLSERMLHQEK